MKKEGINLRGIETKRISVENINEVAELVQNKQSVLKQPAPYVTTDRFIEKIKSEGIEFYGIYNQGKLEGIIGVNKWKMLPYYTIFDLFISTGASAKKYNAYIISAMQKITESMEVCGRFQFYVLTLVRAFQRNKLKDGKMWEVNAKYEPFNRYNVSIETIVPANTRPNYEAYWNMMGKEEFPEDIWIRKYVLKNEFILEHINIY